MAPPAWGITKINTDASFDILKNKASAGIIARNDRGDILAGLTKCFPATSPLMAEALSFREALAFADSMGMDKIVVENDCLDLIKACRNEIIRGEIFNVVKDIIALKNSFQSAGFIWVWREGNKVAHHIAHLGSRGLLPVNWVWNLPQSLIPLLQTDKNLGRSSSFPFDPGSSSIHSIAYNS